MLFAVGKVGIDGDEGADRWAEEIQTHVWLGKLRLEL